jgi:hypothetical protein
MGGQRVKRRGVTELIRKLPELWRCSLIKAELKLSRAFGLIGSMEIHFTIIYAEIQPN